MVNNEMKVLELELVTLDVDDLIHQALLLCGGRPASGLMLVWSNCSDRSGAHSHDLTLAPSCTITQHFIPAQFSRSLCYHPFYF
jgi:hypothetical protein